MHRSGKLDILYKKLELEKSRVEKSRTEAEGTIALTVAGILRTETESKKEAAKKWENAHLYIIPGS